MNARRVHELFLEHRPQIDFARSAWKHLLSNGVLDDTLLKQMTSILDREHLIIHVHRRIGGVMSVEEGLTFIAEHIGQGNIHIFDATFEKWVFIAQNGVATLWSQVDG